MQQEGLMGKPTIRAKMVRDGYGFVEPDGRLFVFMEDRHYDFRCLDCRTDTNRIGEVYTLQEHVWKSVAGTYDGMLCVGCFEKRLGRQLTTKDFSQDNGLNGPTIFHSKRLKSRLGA